MKNIGELVSFFGKEGQVEEIIPNAAADIWHTNLYVVRFPDGTTKTLAESVLDDFVVPKKPPKKMDESKKYVYFDEEKNDFQTFDSLDDFHHQRMLSLNKKEEKETASFQKPEMSINNKIFHNINS